MRFGSFEGLGDEVSRSLCRGHMLGHAYGVRRQLMGRCRELCARLLDQLNEPLTQRLRCVALTLECLNLALSVLDPAQLALLDPSPPLQEQAVIAQREKVRATCPCGHRIHVQVDPSA